MNAAQAFFKCISSSEKMEIPRTVALQMRGALRNRVILRDRYNNTWSIEVDRNGDEWCFKKGWPQFYEANSLKRNNFLVFEYKGANLFDFKLLGDDACEKKGAEARKFRDKEEEVEECEAEEEEDEDLKEENEEYSVSVDDFDDDDDDEDYVQEDEANQEEEQVDTSKKIKPKNKSKSSHGSRTSKQRYKNKNVPDWYGADIFESGLATRPKNPFFVSRSRAPRKNELYIPKDVIVDFCLNIPEKLFLVDERGNRWETKVKRWSDGRLWCNRGWRSLCNVNNINVDDTCICEFVKEEEGRGDMRMLVRVVDRAGAEKPVVVSD